MSILAKYFEFVKEQADFHEKQALKYSEGRFKSEFRNKLHSSTADKFKGLAADLIKADQEIDTSGPKIAALSQQLILNQEELEGLPEELVKELSSAVVDKGEQLIISLINEYGGIISLDRLIVDLYKKTNEINKRSTLTSRLYRMGQKGMVFGVPSKKGFYSTSEISEDEAIKLFGPETTA